MGNEFDMATGSWIAAEPEAHHTDRDWRPETTPSLQLRPVTADDEQPIAAYPGCLSALDITRLIAKFS